jgi:hypothetical protein
MDEWIGSQHCFYINNNHFTISKSIVIMVDLHNFPWLNLMIMISNHIPKPPTISNSIWWSQDLKSHSKISQLHLIIKISNHIPKSPTISNNLQLHLMISRSQITFQNLPTPFDDLKISNHIPKSPNSIWWSQDLKSHSKISQLHLMIKISNHIPTISTQSPKAWSIPKSSNSIWWS